MARGSVAGGEELLSEFEHAPSAKILAVRIEKAATRVSWDGVRVHFSDLVTVWVDGDVLRMNAPR
jgi:hypothetical protein